MKTQGRLDLRVFLIAFAAFSGAGCGKGLLGGPELTVNLLNPVLIATQALQASSLQFDHWSNPAGFFSQDNLTGENLDSQLKSIKYYIKEVRVCESIETTGTAYNNPKGCFSLYKNQPDNYDSYGFEQAKAETGTGKFLDLMDPTTKTKLSQNATAIKGTYHYGLIDWYKPLKVNAEVTMGSDTYVTCGDATATFSAGGGNTSAGLTKCPDMRGTAGSSKETTIVMDNGGSWFKFQNPFMITPADLKKGESYVLDLVFNPSALIKASDAMSNGSIQDDSNRGLFVPLLALSPVVHKSTETAIRESYVLDPAGTDEYNLRLDLYYIKGDTNKTIYGADWQTLKTASTTQSLLPPQKISFIQGGGGGNHEFQDYQKQAMLSEFKRGNSSGSGGTLQCQAAMFHLGCGGGSTAALTITSMSETELK